jgi:hypothetical protein
MRITWRTSSYTSGGGQCVEMGWDAGKLAVRDTKQAGGHQPVMLVTGPTGQAFLAAAKAGRLDR